MLSGMTCTEDSDVGWGNLDWFPVEVVPEFDLDVGLWNLDGLSVEIVPKWDFGFGLRKR